MLTHFDQKVRNKVPPREQRRHRDFRLRNEVCTIIDCSKLSSQYSFREYPEATVLERGVQGTATLDSHPPLLIIGFRQSDAAVSAHM